MLSLIACAVVAVASSLWFMKLFQIALLSPLSQIPNAHFTAPYSRVWLFWHREQKTEHKARDAAHEKYGPVIRIAPRELSVNCLEDGVKTVYGGGFEKGEWYSVFLNYGHEVMFSMRGTQIHTERKRMLSQVYSNSFIQSSEALTEILRTIIYNRSIPRMRVWAEEGTPVDIFQETKALFMDITSAYLFGLKNSSNITENPDMRDILTNFELSFSELFWRVDVPNLTKWMARFGISPISDEISPAYQAMEEFILSMSNRARDTLQSEEANKTTSHPTVYAQLRQKLEASKTIPTEQLDTVVAAEMLDHIEASHKAASVSVSYLMCEVAQHPSILSRLQKELLSVNLDSMSSQQIDALPILDALLMETLRLYTPGLGPFTREVPEKGAIIGAYSVPGGTTISASAYALHRNSNIFPNPLEWNPNRWLDATAEARKEMMRWYWVFGSGGRMCIGNHFAIRIMKAVVAAIFREFESVAVPETRIELVEGLIGYPAGHSVMLAFKRADAATS
ncbi:cytochrome P450 monooxygenase [Sclerotinia borealis F-4128]|uniref:Cytochrome P450 monooxygenase n=1 Tax=Sclerotinia borealis (strain F-4128) TaxID=1432307 RepID=W9CIZ9_SCLBF|nr:cytochrome P450 monooxygenase [Sclerotinia borealis F-4128]